LELLLEYQKLLHETKRYLDYYASLPDLRNGGYIPGNAWDVSTLVRPSWQIATEIGRNGMSFWIDAKDFEGGRLVHVPGWMKVQMDNMPYTVKRSELELLPCFYRAFPKPAPANRTPYNPLMIRYLLTQASLHADGLKRLVPRWWPRYENGSPMLPYEFFLRDDPQLWVPQPHGAPIFNLAACLDKYLGANCWCAYTEGKFYPKLTDAEIKRVRAGETLEDGTCMIKNEKRGWVTEPTQHAEPRTWRNLEISFPSRGPAIFEEFNLRTPWELVKVEKHVSSIMNKISRETFDKLSTLVCDYLTYEPYVQPTLRAFLNKALTEIFYQDLHADLAVRMCNLSCGADVKKLIISGCTTKLLAASYDKGAIFFLGHLCIRKVLPSERMFDKIDELLSDKSDDSVTALCGLLEIEGFGPALECSRFDAQLARLKEISTALSSRVKFLVQGVLDTRARGWMLVGSKASLERKAVTLTRDQFRDLSAREASAREATLRAGARGGRANNLRAVPASIPLALLDAENDVDLSPAQLEIRTKILAHEQNVVKLEKEIALLKEADDKSKMVFGEGWHTDSPFLPKPPSITALRSIEVPPFGGDTQWANSALALATTPRRRNITKACTTQHKLDANKTIVDIVYRIYFVGYNV
jgi:hypothetical protein